MRGTIKSSEPNFHYMESDLPENLEEKKNVLSALQKKHPEMRQPEFREINVLDLQQLRTAADSFSKEELAQGSFAIVCEGLLGYLDFEQKGIAASNIRQVLLEKGGIWITTDVTTKESLKKIWGNPLLAPLVKRFAKETKKDMYENSFDNLETLIQFYQDEGFETELVSDDEVTDKLSSPKKLKLSPQQVHQALRKHYTLVLKPKKEFPVSVE
ncbi:MAG: hypothetical protein M1383_06425 [Patescibacteria group bacterium]|nr:hypothetical protein [Patescibacteria group bacterium]